jgi:hypothetical protein
MANAQQMYAFSGVLPPPITGTSLARASSSVATTFPPTQSNQLPTTVQKERTKSDIANEVSSLVGEYNKAVQLQLSLKGRIEALLKEQEDKTAIEEKAAIAALAVAKKNVLEMRKESDLVRQKLNQVQPPRPTAYSEDDDFRYVSMEAPSYERHEERRRRRTLGVLPSGC